MTGASATIGEVLRAVGDQPPGQHQVGLHRPHVARLGPLRGGLQDAGHLPRRSPSGVCVLLDDQLVKVPCAQFPHLADRVVPPIAGHPDHAHQPLGVLPL